MTLAVDLNEPWFAPVAKEFVILGSYTFRHHWLTDQAAP